MEEEASGMTLTAFLHGYPPGWSMGGEISTHRTLSVVPGSTVFTPRTTDGYVLDGVTVLPSSGPYFLNIMDDAQAIEASVLFAHSTLSQATVRAARRLKKPSILAVHAPPRFAADLRRAWAAATVRLYNTEAARKDWRDSRGWLLHPPIGPPPKEMIDGTGDALTLTSSLLNKGVTRVLDLARLLPDRRFIIVRSPAHETHGSLDFEERAASLDNIEVWDRLHPRMMSVLWAQTKVLLVPSRYETYGLSALEAAWHGIPSVHVDTIHVREGIGEAARLMKSQTVEELRAAVDEVDRDYTEWSAKAHSRAHALREREVRELAAFAAGVAGLSPH
jgi:hypothetical protein